MAERSACRSPGIRVWPTGRRPNGPTGGSSGKAKAFIGPIWMKTSASQMAARLREVIWAESARDALDEIVTYIAQDSRQGAGHVLEAAIEAARDFATWRQGQDSL
jgi:hypothetical protein